MTNYCPGCNHPVLLRAVDGGCGEKECRDYIAAKKRGEEVEAPYVLRRRVRVEQLLEKLRERYPDQFKEKAP